MEENFFENIIFLSLKDTVSVERLTWSYKNRQL